METTKSAIQQRIRFYIGDMYRNDIDVANLWGEDRDAFAIALESVARYMIDVWDRIQRYTTPKYPTTTIDQYAIRTINGLLLWDWCRILVERNEIVHGTFHSDQFLNNGCIIFDWPKEKRVVDRSTDRHLHNLTTLLVGYAIDDDKRIFNVPLQWYALFLEKLGGIYGGIDGIRIQKSQDRAANGGFIFTILGDAIDIKLERETKPIFRSDIDLLTDLNEDRHIDNMLPRVIMREVNRFCYWQYKEIVKNLSGKQIINNPAIHLLSEIMHFTDWVNVYTTELNVRRTELGWVVSTDKLAEYDLYHPHYVTMDELDNIVNNLKDDKPIVVVPKGNHWLYYNTVNAECVFDKK